MTERRQEEDRPVVDIGLNLGGIFKGIGDLIDLVSKMPESELGESRQVTKGVYGFQVKVGCAGRPLSIERFGTLKPRTPTGGEEVREPLVDIFDQGSEIVVIAEVPGVEEKDIKIEVKERELRISAEGEGRKYDKTSQLPAKVADDRKVSCRNGVLELRMKKAE